MGGLAAPAVFSVQIGKRKWTSSRLTFDGSHFLFPEFYEYEDIGLG